MLAGQEPVELVTGFGKTEELGVQGVRFGVIAESHTWEHSTNFGSFGRRGS